MNIFHKIYCRKIQIFNRILSKFITFGEPTLLKDFSEVSDKIKESEVNSILVITSKSVKALKFFHELENTLKESGIKFTTFDSSTPNPTIDMVESVMKIYLENECNGIIAVGGGSVIDLAKAVGARVANPEKSLKKMKGLFKIKNILPLLIAIPTTAGSGSEATPVSVITNEETSHKYPIIDFKLMPKYALLDGNFTISMPANLSVITGMDTLTHAIEAFISKTTTEQSRKNSLESARLVFENIVKVYQDGNNERARNYMLKASHLGGLAITRSYVGYVHAISHTLSGKYDTPHGLANAVILTYVLSSYGSVIYPQLKQLAVYCNIARPYDNEQIASSKLINKILEINEIVGIAKKFDFIKTEDIPELAKYASKEANPIYPVPKLMSAKDLEKIYYNIKI